MGAIRMVAVAATSLGILAASSCRKGSDSPAAPAPEEIFRLGELAPAPRWDLLHRFQHTITRDTFVQLLHEVYLQKDAATGSLVTLHDSFADIARSTAEGGETRPFRLFFADGSAQEKPPPRFWRSAAEMPLLDDGETRPLDGVRIAIDAGHIGGEWAKIEERWYQIDGGQPVMEGSMTLAVARHLVPRLEALGAEVSLVRQEEAPVTASRPADFVPQARAFLESQGIDPDAPSPSPRFSVKKQSERLFYRTREIRDRAQLINGTLQPDLVLCLHFNAEAWGRASDPIFSPKNHFHMLLNGCYSLGELSLDDQRFALFQRLLQRCHSEEVGVTAALAEALAERTGLLPYEYTTPNARPAGTSPYLWARNLLANRVYLCPVAFFEPYVMNNADVYARIQEGDYEGVREIEGVMRPSIFREYADAVAEGLTNYYRSARPRVGGSASSDG